MPHNVAVEKEKEDVETLWGSLEAEAECLRQQAVAEMHKGDYGKSRKLYKKAADLFEFADCLRGYENTKHTGREVGLVMLLFIVYAVLLALAMVFSVR